MRNCTITLTSAFAIAITAGSQFVLAQAPQKAQKILSGAKVDQSFIALKLKPAIAYVPIPLADRNGKPIDPNATAKLSNGQTISARVYFAQLNAFEQKLNKLGYSLRSGTAKQELASPSISSTTLQAQGANLKALVEKGTLQESSASRDKLMPNAPLSASAGGLNATEAKAVGTLNAAGLHGDQIHGMLVDPSDLTKASATHKLRVSSSVLKFKVGVKPAPPKMDSVPISHSKNWSWGYGNKWFGAYFNGAFSLSGVAQVPANTKSYSQDSSSFSTSLSGKAGINLFSDTVDVVNYSAAYSASDVSKQITLNSNATVLGYTVWSVNKSVPDGYKLNQTSTVPLDISTPTMEFPIGPFTISGKFGATGSAGISYSLALYYSNINGNVTPFVKSSAYGQVGGGIDIGIASASVGVDVNLTLLDQSLTIGESAGVGWLLGFYLMDEFYIDNSMNALNGSVHFYIKESEAFGAFSQEQDFTLFNWGGVQDNSSWINIKNIIPLDWNG